MNEKGLKHTVLLSSEGLLWLY